MKIIKEYLEQALKDNPDDTCLDWVYGASIYNWGLISHRLRKLMPHIRRSKNLEEIPIYTEIKGEKKWLDGQPLIRHFTKSCKANPSYGDIPCYEDFKQCLNKAVGARHHLVHRLFPMRYEHNMTLFTPKDSVESFTESLQAKLTQDAIQCYFDIGKPILLFSEFESQIKKRFPGYFG